jgi:hypothetical protein
METMSSVNLSSSYLLQSLLNSALQGTGVTTGTAGNSTSGVTSSAVGQPSDSGQLSPLAQLMSTLQQLQQSDPSKYKQVTQEIATNLQSAAKSATSEGNTTAASQLNQLANDFTTASQSGQLPNIQDLAQAVGGGHHHHHHGGASSADADSNSTSSTSSGSSSNSTSSSTSNSSQTLSQYIASLQSSGSGSQSESLNPMAIILSTLSSAGVTSTSNN